MNKYTYAFINKLLIIVILVYYQIMVYEYNTLNCPTIIYLLTLILH